MTENQPGIPAPRSPRDNPPPPVERLEKSPILKKIEVEAKQHSEKAEMMKLMNTQRLGEPTPITPTATEKHFLTPLFAIEGQDGNISEAYDAEAILAKLREEEAAKRTAALKAMENDFIFYVRCRYHPPSEPNQGVFVRGMHGPLDIVQQFNWNSRYKPKFDQPWTQAILCQVCLEQGKHTLLPLERHGEWGAFHMNPRWFFMRPRNAELAQKIGAFRVHEVLYTSSNLGRAQAVERAQAAGLKVV